MSTGLLHEHDGEAVLGQPVVGSSRNSTDRAVLLSSSFKSLYQHATGLNSLGDLLGPAEALSEELEVVGRCWHVSTLWKRWLPFQRSTATFY